MKLLNNLWRVLRARRDALLEEAKEAARREAQRVVIELMKELTEALGGRERD
jgi:hypothetical protein